MLLQCSICYKDINMKTMPVRINIELKEQLENTMKQYRHKTGENITISDCINKLINDPNFKQLIEWKHE